MPAATSFLAYGKVTDTFYGVLGDSDDDLDFDPDMSVVSGTVTFKPALTAPLLFTSAPFAAAIVPVVGAYDSLGRLSLNGAVGVKLLSTDNPFESPISWNWRAEFNVQVGGIPVTRPSFEFRLPGNSTVDLAVVQPVATVNGVPTTKGDKGDPGVGVKIRGILTGTNSSVLPSGYGAAQDGWAYRVRSVDGTYDELWAWAWTGTAGAWVDCGPAVGSAVIDDSRTTTFTAWSSTKVQQVVDAALTAAQTYTNQQLAAYVPDDYTRRQAADGSWPLRNAPSNRQVTWEGVDFPPAGGGYALYGVDAFDRMAELP